MAGHGAHALSREESTHGARDTSKAEVIEQPRLRTPVIAFLPPPSIFDAAVKLGVEKAHLSWRGPPRRLLRRSWLYMPKMTVLGTYCGLAGAAGRSVGGNRDAGGAREWWRGGLTLCGGKGRWKTLWLGILAGFYLSMGGCLAYSIGGEMPGVGTRPDPLQPWEHCSPKPASEGMRVLPSYNGEHPLRDHSRAVADHVKLGEHAKLRFSEART